MRSKTFIRGGYGGAALSESGSDLVAKLLLLGNPTLSMEAATKNYVELKHDNLSASLFGIGAVPIAALPAFVGDVRRQEGSNTTALNSLGLSPGNYAKVTVDAKGRVNAVSFLAESDIPVLSWSKINAGLPTTVAGYGITDALTATGGTMTGTLSVAAASNTLSSLANKAHVDGKKGVVKPGEVIRRCSSITPVGYLRTNAGLVSKTTYSRLYKIMSSANVIAPIPGDGRPWVNQDDINSNATVFSGSWTTAGVLPRDRELASACVTKNYVYYIGGIDGPNYSARVTTVYMAPINSNGTLGTWTTGPSLPAARAQGLVLLAQNRLYYICGSISNSEASNTVYSVPINADGTLGVWVTHSNFPLIYSSPKGCVIGDKLYVFAGTNVYRATVTVDGIIDSWTLFTTAPSIPETHPFIINRHIYLIDAYSVYRAELRPDGDFKDWTLISSLPSYRAHYQFYVTKNKLYIIGGKINSANTTSEVITCAVNTDGSLGPWTTTTALLSKLTYSASWAVNGYFYVAGGFNGADTGAGGVAQIIDTVWRIPVSGALSDYSEYYAPSTSSSYIAGSGQPWRQQYDINTTSALLGSWTSGINLPTTLGYSSAVVTKNRVYLIGGYSGSATSTVYTAAINSDGTLGTWSAAASLPAALYASHAFVVRNRLYLAGGKGASAITNAVYTAPINTDGTLGAWSTATPLPEELSYSSVVVTKERVYLLGGYNSSGVATSVVYTALINPDGALGAWTLGDNLPAAVYAAQAIVTRNRVYLIGGYSSAAIYTAPINPDSTLGAWSPATGLPGTLGYAASVTTKNRVYIIGGTTGNAAGATSVVYTAPINLDGTLGTWSTGTSLPGNVYGSQLIATSSRLYLLGGYSGSAYTNAVRTVSFSGGLNDYSSYYSGASLGTYIAGAGRPHCQQYDFNVSVSGNLGSWNASERLEISSTLYGGKQLYVVNDSIQFVSGANASAAANCRITLEDDGSYSHQELATFAYSGGRDKGLGLHLKGHYLICGGEENNGGTYTASNEIIGATVSEAGELGNMSVLGTLPARRYRHTGFVGSDGRIYLIGGITGGHGASGTISASVISCNFDSVTRTISGFRNEPSLPAALCNAEVIVTDKKVFVVGGASTSQTTGTNKVYMATIGNDGILSAWTEYGTFPVNLHSHSVFVTRNMAYVFGGSHLTTKYSHVYRAPIDAAGNLGSWTAGTTLPVASDTLQAICVNGKLYLKQFDTSAGHIGSVPFAGGGNDYYLYGTYGIDPNASTDFQLPDITPSQPGVYSYIKY